MPWFCRGERPPASTSLEEYANFLRERKDEGHDGKGIAVQSPSFPMYVVPVEILLKMVEVCPHEELMDRGLLVEFDASLGNAAFVSHQWVGAGHPDPNYDQLRVLQDALRHLLYKAEVVYPSIVSEIALSSTKGLPTAELKSAPLFIWYDYFSCPQREDHKPQQMHAIHSIPAYVARCAFFFGLCPVILNASEQVFTQYTWAERGWCRIEKACRELSLNPTWMIIRGAREIDLVVDPATSLGGPPGEGQFTLMEDHRTLAGVLLRALEETLVAKLTAHDVAGYRALLNLQAVHMRGFPAQREIELVPGYVGSESSESEASSVVPRFFHQNGFTSVSEVDSVGWSPLHYAAIRGDAVLIEGLLAQRADPNAKTRKTNRLTGFRRGDSALNMCLFYKHNGAVRQLIAGRARVDDAFGGFPAHAAAISDNAEGLRLVCQAGANPRQSFLGAVYPFTIACMFGARAVIEELRALDAVYLKECLVYAMIFRGGTAPMVQQLISMRADVNEPSSTSLSTPLGFLFLLKSLQYRFGSPTPLARAAYGVEGRTALLSAIMTGQYDAAAALIVSRAQLDLRDSSGFSALGLAESMSAPEFLVKALLGQQAACETVVRVMLAKDAIADAEEEDDDDDDGSRDGDPLIEERV